MAAIITFIVGLALKLWNGLKPPAIVLESEKAGKLEQALDTEIKSNEAIKDAVNARNDVKPLTPSELQSPEHAKGTDPDFRD